MDLITIYILAIIFSATLVRSTFGFGESLIAVPLLIFVIPIEIAVPLSVLISILIASIVVVQDRKQIYFKSAKWLLIYAALGIPFGLLLLIYGNDSFMKSVLGILIIIYATYSLLSKGSFQLKNDHKGWLFLCGFLSGIFGGAYGLNGPPLVIYGNMRRWTVKKFRATLQAYFLPASILGMIGYWYNGFWNSAVTHYFLICIPIIIPAIFLGRYFNHQMKEGSFIKIIYAGLVCIGVILLIQSLFSPA